MRTAGERLLHAAMLVAKRDFQVQHLFTRALKTEVARLNDARVDRADGHLVNLAAIHAEKFCRWRARCRYVLPHGLEPGMSFGCEAVLLPNFALEQMRLRMRRRERRITRR